MRTTVLVTLVTLCYLRVFSQPCVLVNQMSIATGYNPATLSTIAIGNPDPRWIIDNANNIPGAINNSPAIACVPSGGNASNPGSAWIGYATNSAYVTNNPTVGYYLITYRLPFRTCLLDSLFFNMNLANDNYISEIRIDGIPTGFSQPVSLISTNYTTFSPFVYSGVYSPGNHTIEVDVQNFNVNNAMNPQMLNIYGTINSIGNSIVTYNSPINCSCNAAPMDSVIANFSYAFSNICDSSIVQFTDLSAAINSSIVSWSWDFGDGNTSNFQNPLHDYLLPGNYAVRLIVTNNFLKSDTFISNINVTLSQLPVVSGNAVPAEVCFGQPVIVTGSGASTYTWSSGISNGVPFYPSGSTTYTVTGVNSNGCTNTATVLVVVNQPPNVIANANPQTICLGSSTVFTGSGAQSYIWSGNVINGQSYFPQTTATYTVTGTDAKGCTGTSTITVAISDGLNVAIFPNSPKLCKGDSITLVATGASTYIWQFAQGLSTYIGDSVRAFPSESTTYIVTGSDAAGCSGTASVTIEVIDKITLDIWKSRDAECGINWIELKATGASNYLWTPANLLSNPTSATTNATILNTTVFYVTGSIGSCTATDSIIVNKYSNREDEIYIPNAFTPNSDGINDCFKILQNANFTSYSFVIYNRWGQRVFESDNPNNCWNGEYNNMPLQMETYFYYLKGETNCGYVIRKGDFILLR